MALALLTEDRKPIECLAEQAARARRFAIILHGDPAQLALERYAEELEAEIQSRAAVTAHGSASATER